MIIKVDSKETAAVVQSLCDIVLKVNGVQALNQIVQVLQSITIEEDKDTTK